MAASVSADDFTNHHALATEPPLPSRDLCGTPRDSLPPLPPLGRESNSAPRDIPTPRDHSMTTPPRGDPVSSPREPMPLPREAKGMSPPPLSQPTTDLMPLSNRGGSEIEGMAQFLRKALRIEGPQLNPKTVTIRLYKSFVSHCFKILTWLMFLYDNCLQVIHIFFFIDNLSIVC